MLKIEPVFISEGFADGSAYGQGEYLFSVGMQKTQNGVTPNWNVVSKVDNSTIADLTTPIQFFTQAAPGGTSATYGVDASGNIYQWNGSTWSEVYKPTANNFNGNGLIGGQDGNLYYKGDRYLGQYNGTADYTAGTIAVTNGSAAVVGTGTTFTSSMANKRIVIAGVWYTVASFTDATHITLATNYTGTTASGLSYAIKVGFNDLFQDFGAAVSPSGTLCPMETFEDTVLVAHGAQIGSYNVTTLTFTATAFTLPSNFVIRAIKSGRTGILIAANVGNRSVRILWDNQSLRSIAPWIWSNENVMALEPWNGNWIITTNRRILVSSGFYEDIENELTPFPDSTTGGTYINCLPQGTAVINNYFFLANSAGTTNRIRSGISILNLTNFKWESCTTANNVAINNAMGAIFFDSSFNIHLGWKTTNPAKVFIGMLSNGAPTRASIISAPAGTGNSLKTAEGVRLSLGLQPNATDSRNISFNIAVKIANTKRVLWGFAQTNTTGAALNQIPVDGTLIGLNEAQVGDEITVMEGVNAGQTAHITAIANAETNTEVWTIDTNLTGDIESGIKVLVSPFRLLSKQSITNQSQLRDLLFTCQKSIESRKFYIKIVIDGITFNPPEIFNRLDFIYNDLGEI